jgi:hypothetical protein
VPQHRNRFEPEVLPQAVKVFDVRLDSDIFWLYIVRRLAPPSLVVVDEPVRIGQAIHIGEQIAMVKIGPAVEDDDRLSLSDLAIIQPGISSREVTAMRSRAVRLVISAHRATAEVACDPLFPLQPN